MNDEHTRSGPHEHTRPGGKAEGDEEGGASGPGAAEAGTGSAEDAGRGGGERSGRERPRGRGSAFSDLQEAVGEIVEGAMRSFAPAGSARFPPYDLVRVPEEGYRLLFDLPGVDKADLDVSTVGDELSVSGVRHRPGWSEGSEVLRSERSYGRFRRTLRLPADVDAGEVRAKLEEGVLVVTLPYRKESARQRVEVETGPGGGSR